jgi:hypothetical protein
MSSELAPPPSSWTRRHQRIDAIVAREKHIAYLQCQQRLDVAALYDEDRGGMSEKFVADELACAWARSRRQAQTRLDDARMFAAFPCLHALVGDGTWLMDHADAVLNELLASGLTEPDEQQQVLDLVLSRTVRRTPYELKVAVRTAVVVLFPDHAARRAAKARADRDVQVHVDAPGSAQLYAHGPVADVAAMLASLDALCWPPAPGDDRSVAQRRFDTLRELVCGQARPGQWQVQLLVDWATVRGEDELPGEIPGFGPIPAPVAREIVATGELRRVVVEHGQLVAVDGQVHRPDLVAPQPAPAGASSWAHEDCWTELIEPDPEAPSVDDLAWYDEHAGRIVDDVAASADTVAGSEDSPSTPAAHPVAELVEAPAGLPARWSAAAFAKALHRVRTDPIEVRPLDSDAYQVPTRLKRHLILRDRTCVFPGCTRLAQTCDSDHLLIWPLGRTSELNLADECEHHHQAKHDRFRVQRLPDGTFRWTTPAGLTYDRPPRPVLDNFRYARPPDTTDE